MQDISRITQNYEYSDTFFDGLFEMEFWIKNEPNICLHVWEGYFIDIYDNPPLHGLGWHGFTRDYHEDKGAWASRIYMDEIKNVQEYLTDALQYKDKKFRFEETKGFYEVFIQFLQYAVDTSQSIMIDLP